MRGIQRNILFQLIHSLGKREKAYALGFMKQSGKANNHIQLFKKIAVMKEYDKEKLLRSLPDTFPKGNIAVQQHHLYENILRSLRLYHEERHPFYSVHSIMIEADILHEKGLSELAVKRLAKAKKIAEQLHYLSALVDINQREITWKLATRPKDLLKTIILDYKELIETIERLSEEIRIREYNHLLLGIYRADRQHIKEENRELFQKVILLVDELIRKEGDKRTFFGSYLLENAKAIECRINRNLQEAQLHYSNIITHWESHPKIQKALPKKYYINISNYITNSILVQEWETVRKYLSVLGSIQATSYKESLEYFQNFYFLKMFHALRDYQVTTTDLIPMLSNIETGLDKYEKDMTPTQLRVILYNATILCFLHRKNEACLNWATRLLQLKKSNQWMDIQLFAELISWMIHFDEKSHKHLDTALENIRKKCRREKNQWEYMNEVIKHLKKLVGAADETNRLEILKSLENKLEEFESHIPKPICLMEMHTWTHSKITGKPMLEIHQEKLRVG